MDVEEERPVDVQGAHPAEVRLVPADSGRLVNAVQPRPDRKEQHGAKHEPPSAVLLQLLPVQDTHITSGIEILCQFSAFLAVFLRFEWLHLKFEIQ